MVDIEFSKVGLYPHNAKAYRAVREAFDNGKRVVGIVQGTGTGKTYNALQLAYDNKDKKILFVVPNISIVEHIKETINKNENLDFNRDFPNLEFITYQKLSSMEKEDIEKMGVDLLIIDEFHHIGAPVWGESINHLIDTHPEMKIFGMTAYTVRRRGTEYERDMALEGGDQLFSDNIVHHYDIFEAMLDGVLPIPRYRTAQINFQNLIEELEGDLEILSDDPVKKDFEKIVRDAKRQVMENPNAKKLIQTYLKPNGKYIFFLPKGSYENETVFERAKNEAIKHIMEISGITEDNVVFYETTSKMEDHGKSNRNAFYNDLDLDGNDVSNKLRVIFCIDQYNEGVHAPNVDGVILGRATESDIIYYEQIGRSLSVINNVGKVIEELSQKSLEELIEIANNFGIETDNETNKGVIINRITSPIIIDLVDNYRFFQNLYTRLGTKVEERRKRDIPINKQVLEVYEKGFDVEVVNEDKYLKLAQLREKIKKYSFVQHFEEAYAISRGEIPLDVAKFKDGTSVEKWMQSHKATIKDMMKSGDKKAYILYENYFGILKYNDPLRQELGSYYDEINSIEELKKSDVDRLLEEDSQESKMLVYNSFLKFVLKNCCKFYKENKQFFDSNSSIMDFIQECNTELFDLLFNEENEKINNIDELRLSLRAMMYTVKQKYFYIIGRYDKHLFGSTRFNEYVMIKKYQQQYLKKHYVLPTVREISKALNLPENRILSILRYIELPKDSDIPVTNENEMDNLIMAQLRKEFLDEALETLTPQEEYVLRLRYGLVDDDTRRFTLSIFGTYLGDEHEEGLSLSKVARLWNRSIERIRQIEAKALRKLRGSRRSKKLRDL